MLLIRKWIEIAAQGIEVLAVAIMVSVILYGSTHWISHSDRNIGAAYELYRVVLGKTLLIGFELLVAADIICTVALDMTPKSLGMLGGLVTVQTFLGWSIVV